MGNICRSPTAHGVFRQKVAERQLADHISVDSAGTHAYHIGKQPDSRSIEKAWDHGIQIEDLRARQVIPDDFKTFDYILAMDQENYSALRIITPEGCADKLHFFLAYSKKSKLPLKRTPKEVPDPYFGGAKGFQIVFDLVDKASDGLLAHILTHDLAGLNHSDK